MKSKSAQFQNMMTMSEDNPLFAIADQMDGGNDLLQKVRKFMLRKSQVLDIIDKMESLGNVDKSNILFRNPKDVNFTFSTKGLSPENPNIPNIDRVLKRV